MNRTDLDAAIAAGYTDTGAANRIVPATHRAAFSNVSDFMQKGRTREYYPQDYAPPGTDLQCRRALGCTMTASSSTVTATPGTFETGIVGKMMKVSFAGTSGNDLVATVTARASDGGSVTLSSAAASGTTSYVKVVYWGTDATAYIQAAIMAMWSTSRRGRLIFDCLMTAAGPLVGTSLGDGISYNGQIAFPGQSYTDARRGGYEIVGDTCMQYSDNGPGNVGFTRPSMEAGGVVSFLTTSSPGAAVFTTAGNAYATFNYSNVQFRKIKTLVPTNGMGVGAGIGGVNMSNAVNHQIYECIAGVDDSLCFTADPTYNHIGFENNDLYTDAMNEWSKINSYGFRAGFRMSNEHMRATSLQAYGCTDAFQSKEGMFSLYGDSWIMHWGRNVIRILVGPNNLARNIIVYGLEVETIPVANHPITGATSWCSVAPSGLYIDDNASRKGNGVIVGGVFSGSSGANLDPTQPGSLMKVLSHTQFSAAL